MVCRKWILQKLERKQNSTTSFDKRCFPSPSSSSRILRHSFKYIMPPKFQKSLMITLLDTKSLTSTQSISWCTKTVPDNDTWVSFLWLTYLCLDLYLLHEGCTLFAMRNRETYVWTMCGSASLWCQSRSRFEIAWVKRHWTVDSYSFAKQQFLNELRDHKIPRNSAKLTKVFCENMRNFGKILPRNFAEFPRNSVKKMFYFVQFRISRNSQIPISWPP